MTASNCPVVHSHVQIEGCSEMFASPLGFAVILHRAHICEKLLWKRKVLLMSDTV